MASAGKSFGAPRGHRLHGLLHSSTHAVKGLSWQPVFDRHLRVRGYENSVAGNAARPSAQEFGDLLALLRNACHVGRKTRFAPAVQFVGIDEAALAHPGTRWNLKETAACLHDCGFALCVHLPAGIAMSAAAADQRVRSLLDLRREGVRVMLDCPWQPFGNHPVELCRDACDFVRFDFSADARPAPAGEPREDPDAPPSGTPAWLRTLASGHLVELVAAGIGTHEQLHQAKALSFDLYQGPQLLPGIDVWRAPGNG